MLYKNLYVSLLVLGLLSSCALHNSTSTGVAKYQQAVLCYEAKDYSEASRLFDEALPLLRGKEEEASAWFYQAYCSFYQKKYVQSSARFKYFHETFLRDLRVEEAMYMQGHALYLESPNAELEQGFTHEAAHALRSYLNDYPGGVYVDKASVQLGELENKLALKDFKSAKLYHQLAYYRAAVVTLENFQKDFPGSSHNEEAAYLKADAQYCYFKKVEKTHKNAERDRKVIDDHGSPQCLGEPYQQLKILQPDEKVVNAAIHTFLMKKNHNKEVQELDDKELLSIAIKYCQEFLDNYPDSPYVLAVRDIYKRLSSVDSLKKPLKR